MTHRRLSAELTRLSTLQIHVHCVGTSRATRLPAEVEAAIISAAGEALRNISRHAGTDKAEIVIAVGGDGRVRVSVEDHGRGFGQTRPGGLGVRFSIVRRMLDVGGTADVVSEPGVGTTVHLAWHPTRPPSPQLRVVRPSDRLARNHELTREASYGSSSLHLRVIVVPVLANLYIAVHYSSTSAVMPLSVAVAFVVAGTTLLVARHLDRHPLTLSGFGLLTALLAGCSAVALELAPDGSLHGYESWVVGLVGVTVAVMVFTAPWQVCVFALTGLGLTNVAFALIDPTLQPWDVPLAMLCQPAIAAVSWGIGASLRRSGEAAQADQTRIMAASVASANRRAREVARRNHLAHVDEVVVPFLESIARGAVPVDAESTRNTAQRLVMRTRDDLCLPGLVDDDLRVLLDEARAIGASIEIRAAGDNAQPADIAVRVLDAVLPFVTSETVITMRMADESFGQARLSMIPGLPDRSLTAVRAELDGLPYAVLTTSELMTVFVVDPSTELPTAGLPLSSIEMNP